MKPERKFRSTEDFSTHAMGLVEFAAPVADKAPPTSPCQFWSPVFNLFAINDLLAFQRS